MKTWLIRWIVAALVSATVFVFVFRWLKDSGPFTLPGRNAKIYFRLGEFCRRAGLSRIAVKFYQVGERATESHLRWGVRSGKLALLEFPPEKIDFPRFALGVGTFCREHGIKAFVIRQRPKPGAPVKYQVFLEKPRERALEDFVNSPKLWSSSEFE